MSKAKTKKPTKPKAVKKPTKVEAPAAKVFEHAQRNGVTRPAPGTVCDLVWCALDQLKAAGTDVTFEAISQLVDDTRGKRACAEATIRTQRQRWNTFNASAK